MFTPIKKVVLNVEKTRVGKATDYDKLILEIWTDGNLSPKEAVSTATAILTKHMGYFNFVSDVDDSTEIANVPEDESASEKAVDDDSAANHQSHEQSTSSATRDLYKNLVKTVDELEFSVRSQNCLKMLM